MTTHSLYTGWSKKLGFKSL